MKEQWKKIQTERTKIRKKVWIKQIQNKKRNRNRNEEPLFDLSSEEKETVQREAIFKNDKATGSRNRNTQTSQEITQEAKELKK